MSSFFTLPASQRKRKREDHSGASASKKRGVRSDGNFHGAGLRNRRRDRDRSISGSEFEDNGEFGTTEGSLGESDGTASDGVETAAERRLRLAERYLENIKEEVDAVGFDAADIDRDLIAERLREDVVRS